jgi:hypothetical protein
MTSEILALFAAPILVWGSTEFAPAAPADRNWAIFCFQENEAGRYWKVYLKDSDRGGDEIYLRRHIPAWKGILPSRHHQNPGAEGPLKEQDLGPIMVSLKAAQMPPNPPLPKGGRRDFRMGWGQTGPFVEGEVALYPRWLSLSPIGCTYIHLPGSSRPLQRRGPLAWRFQ